MQHHAEHHHPASRPVTVEVDGEPLGVVIPEGEGVRFLAVRLSAFALDGHTFENLEAARLALGEAVREHDAH
jgi:hypothetical protein